MRGLALFVNGVIKVLDIWEKIMIGFCIYERKGYIWGLMENRII